MMDVAHPRPLRTDQTLALGAFLRRLDWLLMSAVVALVLLGLWAISGVTRDDVPGDPDYYVVRQAVFAGLGAIGFLVAVAVDPDVYRRHARVVYGVMVALLVLVLAAGEVTRGSRRWIELGFFKFQPSEFGKLLLVLSIAGFLAARSKRLEDPRTPAAAVGLALLPAVLVFVEPDIGTSLVYGVALAAMLFVAGLRWLHLVVLAAAAAVTAVAVLWALPSAGVEVLKPYQVDRLTAFLNPDRNPRGLTYNQTQSKTAVGAGGLHGRGVEGATQTNLDYLPEHATDFIFASYAEQRGFVGAAVLLALYLLVVWRGLRIVAKARDAFSAIVAAGISAALLFQVFVNVGMTIGIAPITGIPLPFVSVGGSSLISNLLGVGVLQAIGARSRRERL
jgi:rod shape determining protein RodA